MLRRQTYIRLLWLYAASVAMRAASVPTPTVSPASVKLNAPTAVIFTVAISDPTLIAASVNLQQLAANGLSFSVVGTMYDDGTHGDAKSGDGIFTLQLNLTETAPYPVSYRVSAAFKGSLTRTFSSLIALNVTGATPAVVTFTSPANLTFFNSSPVTVTGTVSDPSAVVTVNGLPAASGAFTVAVPVQEGNNTITATAKTASGDVSTASLQITLDTVPPRVSIDSPYDSYSTTAGSITVTGKANDTVVGTVSNQQVQVTVNGVAAQVENRGFIATAIPLNVGANTITATARDHAGNGGTATIAVTRIAATQSHINIVSGNNQTGPVGVALSEPIVASLVDGSGAAVSGVTVVFSVTQNNGYLTGDRQTVAVTTDGSGQARTNWTLGTRSGSGNNLVEATAVGFAGSAIFAASGLAGGPGQINLDAGGQQMGAVGQPLPHPFVVAVTDVQHNRLADVPVTFKVTQGGGSFAGGQTSITMSTDSDGRALAILTLGPNDGIANNVVEANFSGNSGFPVAFSASGRVPGNPAATRIAGVVLDNTNNPVPGATIRVFLNNVGAQQSGGLPPNVSAVSDAQGQFLIQPAPVGYVKIIADGSTVTRPGKWPNLEYDLVTVSGQVNSIGLPIYLLPLDQKHQLCVSNTQGGTLTLPAIPGFSLSVLPGSATFPGGSKTGCITVTAVHPDKIPMVPGFGQQPRFIVTIQPAGTLFSPPASISIPNADGLAPREVTEMYSFDHDLNTFVSVGTGTVSDDATVIRSDPGVGVLKAGWYCGGPPTPSGSVGVCGECKVCNGSGCAVDTSLDGQPPGDNKCKTCMSGVATDIPISPVETETKLTYGFPAPVIQDIQETFLDPLKKFGVRIEVKGSTIAGTATTKECCSPEIGKGHELSGSLSGTYVSGSVFLKVWPLLAPNFEYNSPPENLGFVIVTVKAEFDGGLFIGADASVKGELGYRKKECSMEQPDRDGCFYGKFGVVVTPTVKAIATATGEIDAECVEFCTGTYVAKGSATVTAGDLEWDLNFDNFGLNADNCGTGFSSGAFTPGEGKAKISLAFSLEFSKKGSSSFPFDKTLGLSCPITSSGVTCAPE